MIDGFLLAAIARRQEAQIAAYDPLEDAKARCSECGKAVAYHTGGRPRRACPGKCTLQRIYRLRANRR